MSCFLKERIRKPQTVHCDSSFRGFSSLDNLVNINVDFQILSSTWGQCQTDPPPPSKTSQLVQRILKWASSFNTTHSCWQHSLSQLTTRPCWLTRSCQEFRRRACSLLIRQARCLLSTALCVNVAEQDHIIWTQAVHNSSLHHSTWANTPTSSSREGCTNRWGFGKNDRDMTIYQSARAESKSTSVPPSPLGTAEGHQGCTDGRQDIPPRFCVLVFGVISYSTQHRVGVGVGFYLRSFDPVADSRWIWAFGLILISFLPAQRQLSFVYCGRQCIRQQQQ